MCVCVFRGLASLAVRYTNGNRNILAVESRYRPAYETVEEEEELFKAPYTCGASSERKKNNAALIYGVCRFLDYRPVKLRSMVRPLTA